MSIVVIWKGFAFWPSMTRVARLIKLQFMVLEMKGKDREALRGERRCRDRRSRHRGDSCPSHDGVDGLWCDFEPFRAFRGPEALSRPRRRRLINTPSPRRHRGDHVTLKFLLTDSPQVALDDLDVVVARHKLDVHGSTDVEGFRDLRGGALDLLLGLDVELLRG